MAAKRPPLHERTNAWYFLAAAFGAVGAFPYFIGSAQVPKGADPWNDSWVVLAFAFWVLAVAALLCGIGLYVFHTWRAWRRRRAKTRKAAQDALVEKFVSDKARQIWAAEKERQDREAAEQRQQWQPDSFVAMTGHQGQPERTMALRLAPPANRDPMSFHGTYANCEVWRGANRFVMNEPTLYRYNMGYGVAFPQDFDTSPSVPDWWWTLPTECRLVWHDADGAILREHTVVIPPRDRLSRLGLGQPH